MNLNQQSQGAQWATHKALMQNTSPVVDCGVHYVDVMCEIRDATPTRIGTILVHRPTGDTRIDLANEPDHQALCDAEQTHVLHAIRADLDLTRPMQDAVQSLWICLAADESIRTGRSVSRPVTASFGLKVRLASAVQCLWGSWASCKVCPP